MDSLGNMTLRNRLMGMVKERMDQKHSEAMMPLRNQAGGFGFIGGGESRLSTAAETQAFNTRLRDKAVYGTYGKGGLKREEMAQEGVLAREKIESEESIEGQKRDIEERRILQAGVLAQEKAKLEALMRSTMTPKERADVELKIKEIDARSKGLWNIRSEYDDHGSDKDTSGGMTGGRMPAPGASPKPAISRAAETSPKKQKIPMWPLKTPTGMESILGTAAKEWR